MFPCQDRSVFSGVLFVVGVTALLKEPAAFLLSALGGLCAGSEQGSLSLPGTSSQGSKWSENHNANSRLLRSRNYS